MRFALPIVIRIDFPALDALVAYLNSQGQQQAQVDAMTLKVDQLTTLLRNRAAALQGAINQPQGD